MEMHKHLHAGGNMMASLCLPWTYNTMPEKHKQYTAQYLDGVSYLLYLDTATGHVSIPVSC